MVEAIDAARGRGWQVEVTCQTSALWAMNLPAAEPAPHHARRPFGNRHTRDQSDELAGTVRMLR